MRYSRYNPFTSREGATTRRVFGTVAALALAGTVSTGCSNFLEPDCSTYLEDDGVSHVIESDKLPGKRVNAFATPSYNPEGIKLNVGNKNIVLNQDNPKTVYELASNVAIAFTFVEAPFEKEPYRPYVQAECIDPKPA